MMSKRIGRLLICALLWNAASVQAQVSSGSFAGAPASVMPYLQQAFRARQGGDAASELSALEQGLQTTGVAHPDSFWLYRALRMYYADRGVPAKALEAAEQEVAVARLPGLQIPALASVVSLRGSLYNRAGAQAALDKLAGLLRQLRNSPNWATRGNLWQAFHAWASGGYEARLGHPDAAQAAWKACLGFMAQAEGGEHHFLTVDCATEQAMGLAAKGRLAEAGALMVRQRELLQQSAEKQLRPALIARLAAPAALIAIEQGRLQEARRIAADAIEQLLSMDAGEDSRRVGRLRLLLAQIDMLEDQWPAALEKHEQRLKGLGGDIQSPVRGSLSVDYAYTLYRLERYADAEEMMRRIQTARRKLYDPASLFNLEANAFLGVMQAANGKPQEAFANLSQSLPGLLALLNAEGSASDGGTLRSARLSWLLEAYLALLAQMAAAGDGGAAAEAFRVADLARGSSVQQALSAAVSRSVPADPALADLARQEQDSQRDMQSLTETIGDLLARGRISESDKVVVDLRQTLAGLRDKHAQVVEELGLRFPAYAALLNPRPLAPEAIQSSLQDDEALVAIFSTRKQTLVWAFGARGNVAFNVIPVGQQALAGLVRKLRQTLDPGSSGGSIPKFDTVTAYELYRQLLQPVEAGWRGKAKLYVVPHGPLGQLPFATLLTAPWSEKPAKIAFAGLSEAPWLLKEAAVTQLPAALALPLLRREQRPAAEAAFVGFGDPWFSRDDARQEVGQRRNLAIKPAAAAKPVQSHIDTALDFSLLAPLPDTSLEIQEIARALQSDPGASAYLRQRATETNVRQQDLARYRIVMFATHGLVPGEMPGMYQPALALSNPQLTGEAADGGVDGMLSMDEVLNLRLNADWVVLSACNTAAADGKGSEAVSGLGRAFFYAGARSLLVTNWPVETVSARLLTTEIFRQHRVNTGISRAVLLQKSSLSLLKQGSKSFSYAHPMFWAPYILVGDGG